MQFFQLKFCFQKNYFLIIYSIIINTILVNFFFFFQTKVVPVSLAVVTLVSVVCLYVPKSLIGEEARKSVLACLKVGGGEKRRVGEGRGRGLE